MKNFLIFVIGIVALMWFWDNKHYSVGTFRFIEMVFFGGTGLAFLYFFMADSFNEWREERREKQEKYNQEMRERARIYAEERADKKNISDDEMRQALTPDAYNKWKNKQDE